MTLSCSCDGILLDPATSRSAGCIMLLQPRDTAALRGSSFTGSLTSCEPHNRAGLHAPKVFHSARPVRLTAGFAGSRLYDKHFLKGSLWKYARGADASVLRNIKSLQANPAEPFLYPDRKTVPYQPTRAIVSAFSGVGPDRGAADIYMDTFEWSGPASRRMQGA